MNTLYIPIPVLFESTRARAEKPAQNRKTCSSPRRSVWLPPERWKNCGGITSRGRPPPRSAGHDHRSESRKRVAPGSTGSSAREVGNNRNTLSLSLSLSLSLPLFLLVFRESHFSGFVHQGSSGRIQKPPNGVNPMIVP